MKVENFGKFIRQGHRKTLSLPVRVLSESLFRYFFQVGIRFRQFWCYKAANRRAAWIKAYDNSQSPDALHYKEEFQKKIDVFLENQLITPYHSPYNAPALLVPKKNGKY